MKKIILISIMVVVTFSGLACAKSKPQPATKADSNNITKVINNYDKGLIAAQETLDSAPIKNYITENQLKIDEDYIGSLKKDRVKLNNNLMVLKIVKITKAGQKAIADTEEVWRVVEEKFDGKKTDNGEMYYKTKYNLVLKGDKWLIDDINVQKVLSNSDDSKTNKG